MKPATAWILLVIAMCGVAYWFVTRGRLHYPPPEVAALELARGDIARSSSCLSVDAVLRANGFTDATKNPTIVWTSRVRDEWTMRFEFGGSSWRAYTFQVEGNQLVPVNVVSSDDLPKIDLQPSIDEWIGKIHSPAADSCQPAGG
jgi:hypothetical protein